jgi:hypothetical protein
VSASLLTATQAILAAEQLPIMTVYSTSKQLEQQIQDTDPLGHDELTIAHERTLTDVL